MQRMSVDFFAETARREAIDAQITVKLMLREQMK